MAEYNDRAYSLPVQRNPLDQLCIDLDIDWPPPGPLANPHATEIHKMRAKLLADLLAERDALRAELAALLAEHASPESTPRPFPVRALRHRVQAIGLISTMRR